MSPTRCPWGQKALTHCPGADPTAWKTYDASQLVSTSTWQASILMDQGMADSFLSQQLMPDIFEQACTAAGKSLTLRRQDGYDHSYCFISAFISDHIQHHAQILGA